MFPFKADPLQPSSQQPASKSPASGHCAGPSKSSVWIIFYIWSRRSWRTDVSLFSKHCQGRFPQTAWGSVHPGGVTDGTAGPDAPGYGAAARGRGEVQRALRRLTEPLGFCVIFQKCSLINKSFVRHRRALRQRVYVAVLRKETITTPPS